MRGGGSHHGTMIPRVILAVVAVVAAAWLALSLRNDQLTLNGFKTSVLAAAAPPGPVRDRLIQRAVRDLHGARFMNPDITPATYEALVQGARDPEAGARRLVELSRSYPGDPYIWATILRLVRPSDPRAAQAQAHLRALIPQRPR